MAVSPAGPISLTLDHLRNSIAGSTSFRTWTGTANEAAALVRVHAVENRTALGSADMPFAVVNWLPDYRRIGHADGSARQFRQEGSLMVTFRGEIVSPNAAEPDAAYSFLNNVGAVMNDMEALSATATYLSISGMTFINPPHRPEEDEVKELKLDFYQLVLAVEFDGS